MRANFREIPRHYELTATSDCICNPTPKGRASYGANELQDVQRLSASDSNAPAKPFGSPQEILQYGRPDAPASKSTSDFALPTKISGFREPRHA